MRLVYLAHPVEGVQTAEAAGIGDLKAQIRQALEALGIVVYDPSAAFGGSVAGVVSDNGYDSRVFQIDQHVVSLCDGLFLVYGRSFGSGSEVEMAVSSGTPVVALVPDGVIHSAMLVRSGVTVLHDLDGAVEVIDRLTRMRQQSSARRVQRMMVAGLGELPTRAYRDDAGFDLVASEEVKIGPGDTQAVPFDISVQMPPGYWAWITGRSSMMRNRRLLVTNSIIDEGYRGPLFADVTNMNGAPVVVAKGDRVAQLIPMRNDAPSISPMRVAELDETDRGAKGFGSSGR